MAREVNWRDPDSLVDINAWQAFEVLQAISAHFKQSTTDSRTHDERLDSMDGSAEAASFADAANALGRKLRSAGDCRPGLRQQADAKREQVDPALEYAENCRAFHRK
jgi:hypothetical protein